MNVEKKVNMNGPADINKDMTDFLGMVAASNGGDYAQWKKELPKKKYQPNKNEIIGEQKKQLEDKGKPSPKPKVWNDKDKE